MLTGKQRSYLKGLANEIDPIFQVGKNGITDNFIKQIDEALEARELIKVNVLNNSLLEAKDKQWIGRNIRCRICSKYRSQICTIEESVENKNSITWIYTYITWWIDFWSLY